MWNGGQKSRSITLCMQHSSQKELFSRCSHNGTVLQTKQCWYQTLSLHRENVSTAKHPFRKQADMLLHAEQWKVSGDLLTCGWPDGWGDVGRCQRRYTFIILGIACLNGTQVTVASCSETSREVKGIHCLSFNFTKHWFTHRFKLSINLCFTHLNKQQQCIWFLTCFLWSSRPQHLKWTPVHWWRTVLANS